MMSTSRLSTLAPTATLFLLFLLLLVLQCQCSEKVQSNQNTTRNECAAAPNYPPKVVVLIKIGGSSITNKGHRETLDPDALEWFASIVSSQISPFFRRPSSFENDDNEKKAQSATVVNQNEKDYYSNQTAFVIVHGAGSFGHHTAKEYGLQGYLIPPPLSTAAAQPSHNDTSLSAAEHQQQQRLQREREQKRRHQMQGLSHTRLSVQTLNHHVVSTLVKEPYGINAVGISPCFAIPHMQAHGGDASVRLSLWTVVQSALQAGLVPVLHGDACLYGTDGQHVGIVSGDVLMELLGTMDASLITSSASASASPASQWSISQAIFLTDVDGVFTADPRTNLDAELLRTIPIDAETGAIMMPSEGSATTTTTTSSSFDASASTHEHDVTGGLKVRKGSPVT